MDFTKGPHMLFYPPPAGTCRAQFGAVPLFAMSARGKSPQNGLTSRGGER